MVLWILVISLAGPLEKAMLYFKFTSFLFMLMTIGTIMGMTGFMLESGLYPQERKCEYEPSDPKHLLPCKFKVVKKLNGDPVTHFSILIASGWVMLTVFFLPMILRPKDFLAHFKGYIFGWMTYMFLLPTFMIIMNIYSMCNLHDISWGNRPSVVDAGASAFAESAKKQIELGKRYQMFRANFLCFWVILNGLYIILIDARVSPTIKPTVVNDGTVGFIEGFSAYLAAIVLYKLVFAVLHLLRFKMRLACNPDLRVQEVDLVKDQRKRRFGGDGESCESILSQELALMAEEEEDDRQDDARLAVSLGPDQAIQDALRERADDERKKLEASALDKTQYNDADDDASEFDASQLDDATSSHTYATGFSASRAGRTAKSRR